MGAIVRLLLVVAGGLLVLAAVAVAASAVLDRPAKTVTNGATVQGTKAEVWEVLTDLEGYDDWNPVFRRARGDTGPGGALELVLRLPGHDPETLEASVLVSRSERKLWWRDRLGPPGVRDLEYEFVLEPVGNGRVLVVQQLRTEGVLAPFADAGAARRALDLIARSLERRLAAGR